VSTTGPAATPEEYRSRLDRQPDAQIDAWTTELLRDLSIRRGVRPVIDGFCRTTGLDRTGFARVFAAGGGAPSTLGSTAGGDLMVPAIELWCLVPGLRQELPDSRARLIDYLVANFHEMTFT
jgi:hypothetical protein